MSTVGTVGNGTAPATSGSNGLLPDRFRFKRLSVPEAVFNSSTFRDQMERAYAGQVDMVEPPLIRRKHADELSAKRRQNYLRGQLGRFFRRARGCPTIVNLGTARDNSLSDASKRVLVRLAERCVQLNLAQSNGAGDCGLMGFNSHTHAKARVAAGCGPDSAPLIHVPLLWLCPPDEEPEKRSPLGTDGYRCPPLHRFEERTPSLETAGEPLCLNAFEDGHGTDQEIITHLLHAQMGSKNGVMYANRPAGTKPPLHLVDPYMPDLGEYLYDWALHWTRNKLHAGTISPKDIANVFVLRVGNPQPARYETPIEVKYFPSEADLVEFILWNSYQVYTKLKAAYAEIARQPSPKERAAAN